MLIEREFRGYFPNFDTLMGMAFDVIYCLYRMKRIHWFAMHSDWFREIRLLSNLNGVLSSSMHLSFTDVSQLGTNQNTCRTKLIIIIIKHGFCVCLGHFSDED